MLALALFLFILGVAVGSFLNVVVDRSGTDENPLLGRSHCDFCKHKLAWYDLIPLISFTSLRGDCRYCHKRLSVYYPVVELVTGSLFVFILFAQSGIRNQELGIMDFSNLVYHLLIISTLIVIFFTDLKFGIIPFKAVLFGFLATLIYLILNTFYLIPNFLLSGLGAAAFILLPFLITRGRGMGFGDVVYAFFMGFILGFPKIIIGFYVAFVTGAIISLLLVGSKRKKLKGGTIPFGPFLVFGTITALFWGDYLMSFILPYLR